MNRLNDIKPWRRELATITDAQALPSAGISPEQHTELAVWRSKDLRYTTEKEFDWDIESPDDHASVHGRFRVSQSLATFRASAMSLSWMRFFWLVLHSVFLHHRDHTCLPHAEGWDASSGRETALCGKVGLSAGVFPDSVVPRHMLHGLEVPIRRPPNVRPTP